MKPSLGGGGPISEDFRVGDRDARLEGYREWKSFDAFEDYVGPLYYKEADDGEIRCAFVAADNHVNGQSVLHGGMLMTFADYAVFLFARKALGNQRAVTVSFSSDFTAAVGEGEFIEATGEVVHETGGLLFMRGRVFCEETTLLRFSAVLKKLRAPGH